MKPGHKAANCWEIDANAHKRPDRRQPRKKNKDDETVASKKKETNDAEIG